MEFICNSYRKLIYGVILLCQNLRSAVCIAIIYVNFRFKDI